MDCFDDYFKSLPDLNGNGVHIPSKYKQEKSDYTDRNTIVDNFIK